MSWDERKGGIVKDLAKVLVKTKALRFGAFTLTSGKSSSYYVDLRIVPSFPDVFRRIVDAYIELIKNEIGVERIDVVAAIPTAGLTYASVVAFSLLKPLIYVRKEDRLHGIGRRIEGAISPGAKVVVLDDLITTGGSILKAAEAIKCEGGVVTDSVVLIDRLEGGSRNLASSGIELTSLTNIKELATILEEMNLISEYQKSAIYMQLEG